MIITISQIVLVLSIIGILFILIKKVPILLTYPRYTLEGKSFVKDIANKISRAKKSIKSNNFFDKILIPKTEKLLRKTKISLLKLDNFLSKRSDKLRNKIKKKEEDKKEEDNMI
ncbi:MAG: hypothetical protein GF387_00975 [Candidatus Portnoybacteria bacterium]|nr:hypothetical protein [Candidatus Portnoybacteria bacterium]